MLGRVPEGWLRRVRLPAEAAGGGAAGSEAAGSEAAGGGAEALQLVAGKSLNTERCLGGRVEQQVEPKEQRSAAEDTTDRAVERELAHALSQVGCIS